MNKGKEEYDKSSVFRCRRHIVCVYKVQQPCNAKSRELYRGAAWNITGGFKRSNLKGTGENRRQDWILPSIFSQPADTFSKHLGDIKKPVYPYANEMYKIYWEDVLKNACAEPGNEKLLILFEEKNIYTGIGSDMTSYIQNKK